MAWYLFNLLPNALVELGGGEEATTQLLLGDNRLKNHSGLLLKVWPTLGWC